MKTLKLENVQHLFPSSTTYAEISCFFEPRDPFCPTFTSYSKIYQQPCGRSCLRTLQELAVAGFLNILTCLRSLHHTVQFIDIQFPSKCAKKPIFSTNKNVS